MVARVTEFERDRVLWRGTCGLAETGVFELEDMEREACGITGACGRRGRTAGSGPTRVSIVSFVRVERTS